MKPQSVRLSVLGYATLAITGSLFFSGCATTGAPRPTQYPSSVKDWNKIDHVEFLQEFRLDDYTQLVVEPFDTSSTPLPPKDDNTYELAIAMLKRADTIVLTELERALKGKLPVVARKSDAPPTGKTLLLRGKVEEMNPGSRALRYWVSFGAGSAWVLIRGELVDEETGKVLVKFEQRRVGAMGLFGGDYNAMLTDCFEWIARDIGRLLLVFKD